jgi:hypothetical protein
VVGKWCHFPGWQTARFAKMNISNKKLFSELNKFEIEASERKFSEYNSSKAFNFCQG